MRRDNQPTIDIACRLMHETAQAWLVNDGVVDAWLPKSEAQLEAQPDGTYLATMPEWLAEKKRLV